MNTDSKQSKVTLEPDDQLFADTWLTNSFNGTQAALSIWPSLEYGSAKSKAHEKLTNPDILNYIQETLESKFMEVNEALARLSALAKIDGGELFEDGQLLSMDAIKERGLSFMIKSFVVEETYLGDSEKPVKVITKDVKLHDSHKAIQDILKAHGKLQDKLELSGSVNLGAEVVYYLPEKQPKS